MTERELIQCVAHDGDPHAREVWVMCVHAEPTLPIAGRKTAGVVARFVKHEQVTGEVLCEPCRRGLDTLSKGPARRCIENALRLVCGACVRQHFSIDKGQLS